MEFIPRVPGQIVFTNEAKCHDCYRCIRHCPVKAIRMYDGQAYVDNDMCISCGTCIRECPQHAKTYRRDAEKVKKFLSDYNKVAITIAPSYAAYYQTWQRKRLVAALRSMRFFHISETAVGAYYVAKKTKEYIDSHKGKAHIGSACPAVVSYIEKYEPKLVDNIIPVISPMAAHAKHLKAKLGDDVKIVFVGPCVAKKAEAQRNEYENLVDVVLTFDELNQWFAEEKIDLKTFEESEFDELPLGDSRLYPLMGGSSRTGEMDTDILSAEIISVSGYDEIEESLDMAKSTSGTVVIEPLFCSQGCINGPGVEQKENIFERKKRVLTYAKNRITYDSTSQAEDLYDSLELCSEFTQERPVVVPKFSEDEINSVLEKTGKTKEEDHLNCGSCGYNTCREKAIAVLMGMAELNMCLPYVRKIAEQRTDRIIETSPNGIVILDLRLNIIHTNNAFRKFFQATHSVNGKHISYLMDPEPFQKVASGDSDKLELTVRHDRYGITCHQIIYKLKEEKQYVGIFVNITNSLADKVQLSSLKRKTIMQAQELFDHQVTMAQNIAKLLGESTARGEELVENLMQLAEDEEKVENKKDDKWLWDTYISK